MAGIDPDIDFGPIGAGPDTQAAAHDVAAVGDPGTGLDDRDGHDNVTDHCPEFLGEDGFFMDKDGCVVPLSVIGTESGEA